MRDNQQPFSWTLLIGDGLLLLCALTGFAGSFLSLYGGSGAGWSRTTALERCAADGDLLLAYAALLGLITLAAWSLPRYWNVAAGGLTALWAAGMLWNWTGVVQGAGVTVREITAIFASRVYWGQTFSYGSGLRPAQEADAVRLFLLLALAGLALLLGWAVVRSRRWWVVLALTLPPLLPGLLADLYPDWLPFMALAACWCVMLLTALCRWAAPDRRGRLTLAVFPAVALTLALITLLFPREDYARPDWARRAEGSLLDLTGRLSDYLPHWDGGPFRSTVTYVGAAEEADLAHAGPLSYTGRTVLRVTSDYDGLMYLRGSSLALYEDGVWKALPNGTYEGYWSGQEPEVSPLYFPAMLEQRGAVYTVTVDNVGSVGRCVYVPYFPLPQDVNESGMLPVEDAYYARKQGQWSHTVTFVDLNLFGLGGYNSIPRDSSGSFVIDGNYFVYETAGSTAQTNLSAYAGYVYENYLDVPEDLREVLEQYSAAYPYGYFHPVLMARQFGSYLDAICEYDANAPAAPEGVDPVYYFLYESHRGYCMHYASAVTLMLRAAGVPARYVSGFAAEVSPGRQTDVPDRAAHAWVEVWVDGFGWYPVEVTPDAAFNWARPGAQNTEPVEATPEPTEPPLPVMTLEPTRPPRPGETPELPTATPPGGAGNVDGPGQGGSGPDFTVLVNVWKRIAPVIGVLFAVWFIQFAVKRFRAWRMSGADPNRSALVCYGYLCRLGRWGGRMNPQALELAQKARFSQHILTQEELGLLRYLVDRERSRLCVVSGLPRRLVFRYWWGRPGTPVPPADRTPPAQEE